ncbi:MAG: hypothetical protein IPK53_10210 [bacterium]|nr:hypothetical protein [bacterium]
MADLFRDVLVILVGMSSDRWYPEQMFRGALILAMKLTGHLWEEVSTAVGDLEWDSLVSIYQEYRHDYLLPFAELSPLGREVIRLRGEMRVQWFEALSECWLKLAPRKIVVFPHGIYSITSRLDRRKPGKMVAALQKGRRVNGRICSPAGASRPGGGS